MEPTTCVQAELFCLRVLDDSMAPEFVPGAIVVVDPTGVARDGAFVVASTASGYVLRRLSMDRASPTLEALNPGYPSLELDDGLEVVLGVVVQRAGRRRRERKRYE